VTGSGNGIGKAIAGGLAREGAKVVVAELDAEAAKRTEAEIRDAGGEAMAVMTDVFVGGKYAEYGPAGDCRLRQAGYPDQ